MTPRAELDWHLRRHELGSCGEEGIRFDWDGLAARRVIIVPNFEVDPRAVYEAVRAHDPGASFVHAQGKPRPLPNPGESQFFVNVDSAVASLASSASDIVYVNYFTEEAYLAGIVSKAEHVFGESVFDLVARAFARCIAQGILAMPRHSHGERVFIEALQHLERLSPEIDLPKSVML